MPEDPIPESRKLYPRKPKTKPETKRVPPPPAHQYAYLLKPETVAELNARGIQFVTVDTESGPVCFGSDRYWPAFKLPSGKLIMISRDDEGNGPGSIMEAQS